MTLYTLTHVVLLIYEAEVSVQSPCQPLPFLPCLLPLPQSILFPTLSFCLPICLLVTSLSSPFLSSFPPTLSLTVPMSESQSLILCKRPHFLDVHPHPYSGLVSACEKLGGPGLSIGALLEAFHLLYGMIVGPLTVSVWLDKSHKGVSESV